MAFDTDYTSGGYNAYSDVSTIDEIMVILSPFNDVTNWDNLDTTQKENAILLATQDVNCFEYKGVVAEAIISDFNMKFPRSDFFFTNGNEVPNNEIPYFINNYIAERILERFELNLSDANKILLPNNVRRNKVGSLEQEFFSPADMTVNELSLNDFASYKCNLAPYVSIQSGGNFKYLLRA